MVRCGTADAAIGRGRVTVCADATLDLGAGVNTKSGSYGMDLAGTVIATNAADQCVFGSVTLSDDATIFLRDEYGSFRNAAASPSRLALNGHTLTLKANGFAYVGAWNDVTTGGRLLFDGPVGSRFDAYDGYNLASNTVEFTGGAVFKGAKSADVGDFIHPGATWQLSNSASTLSVHGTFRPGEMYPALTMCDGSTLDLSAKTGTWNSDGIPSVAGSVNPRVFTEPGLVSFKSGATVTIDLHGRTLALSEKIISWSQKPEGAIFAFDVATAAGGVSPKSIFTGRYGCAALVRSVKGLWLVVFIATPYVPDSSFAGTRGNRSAALLSLSNLKREYPQNMSGLLTCRHPEFSTMIPPTEVTTTFVLSSTTSPAPRL
jgi:hypothetical protein